MELQVDFQLSQTALVAERLSLLALWQVFQLFRWVLNWSLNTSVMEKHSVCVCVCVCVCVSGDWLNPAPLATGAAAAELSPPPPYDLLLSLCCLMTAHTWPAHTLTLHKAISVCVCLTGLTDCFCHRSVCFEWNVPSEEQPFFFFFFHSFIQAWGSWKNTHLLKCFWGWLSWWVTHYLMTRIKQPVFSKCVIRMILFSLFLMFYFFALKP